MTLSPPSVKPAWDPSPFGGHRTPSPSNLRPQPTSPSYRCVSYYHAPLTGPSHFACVHSATTVVRRQYILTVGCLVLMQSYSSGLCRSHRHQPQAIRRLAVAQGRHLHQRHGGSHVVCGGGLDRQLVTNPSPVIHRPCLPGPTPCVRCRRRWRRRRLPVRSDAPDHCVQAKVRRKVVSEHESMVTHGL